MNTDEHSDDLLHGPLLTGLSQADKNLATALVLGTLRRQLQLEARLMPLLARPDVELPSQVANALRLGAFQLLHMDRIPDHAAIAEAVETVKAARHPGAAGMVNAILRKLALEPKEPKRKIVESPAALAERLGHPEWMVERWLREYGREVAEAVCAYDLSEPAKGAAFATRESFEIDDGSRLVAELAAAAQPEAKRVWDACAAPGGKTAVLAHRLPQAELLATDISPKRLERMKVRLERMLGVGRVRTFQADAAKLLADENGFDLILCDAPCSGTGTLARNPEIKVRLDAGDLARQAERQRTIVQAALARLSPGGRLVYSTCSLEPEENERVVAALNGASVVPMSPLLQRMVASGALQVAAEDAQRWVRGDFLRTLPGANFAGDGFFAAVLERQ
jgi:16S rRNA (cytosine967-C5)-methyltransferase